jgi:hypothetical protein
MNEEVWDGCLIFKNLAIMNTSPSLTSSHYVYMYISSIPLE